MKQFDIYLMAFPFSDLSANKVRPVLVISNNHYNNAKNDVAVIPITSNLNHKDYFVKMTSNDLKQGILYCDSFIKCDKIFTCHKTLLFKKIGQLKAKFQVFSNQSKAFLFFVGVDRFFRPLVCKGLFLLPVLEIKPAQFALPLAANSRYHAKY